MNNENCLKEIRPVVVPLQYLIAAPFASAFFALFPGFFTFIISNIIQGVRGQLDRPILSIGVGVFIVSWLVAMVLFYLKMFKEPERTTYAIYPDRLEYAEGFLNRQQRTVVFDQVIDIQLTEGLLQQTRGAGSIVLVTQQLLGDGQGHLSNRRVILSNISQPREVYELLRSLALGKSEASRNSDVISQ